MLEPPAADPADLSAARLAAIVSSSDDAIVGKTLEGRVTSWNDAAARIFGWSAEEMIGQSITRIIPSELLFEEEDILARLRRGERVAHFETERIEGRPPSRMFRYRVADLRRERSSGGRIEDRPGRQRPQTSRENTTPAGGRTKSPGEEHVSDDSGNHRPVAPA
jgi:PAS domain S-box-containing protein